MAQSRTWFQRIGIGVAACLLAVSGSTIRAESLLETPLPFQTLTFNGIASGDASLDLSSGLSSTDAVSRSAFVPRRAKLAERTLDAYQSDGFAYRVGFELEALSAFRQSQEQAVYLEDHILFEQLSDSIERSSLRVAKHVLGDLLMEATTLDRTVSGIRDRGRPGNAKRIDWRFGFRSMLPKVEMRYRLNRSSLGVSVDRHGFGVSFRDDRLGRNEVRARIRGADEMSLNWAMGF